MPPKQDKSKKPQPSIPQTVPWFRAQLIESDKLGDIHTQIRNVEISMKNQIEKIEDLRIKMLDLPEYFAAVVGISAQELPLLHPPFLRKPNETPASAIYPSFETINPKN